MVQIIQLISLAVLWVCIGLNVWVTVRGIRLNKQLQLEQKLCMTLMNVSMEFINAHIEKNKKSQEVSDEGND